MRRFFKSLTDLSLIQQVSIIIVTFIVTFILFFSVYLRGNIDDFVTNQVMSLLDRNQTAIITSFQQGTDIYSDIIYTADISHFMFRNEKMFRMSSTTTFDQEQLEKISEFALSTNLTEYEGRLTLNDEYYYRIVNADNIMILSIIPVSYGTTIETQLLSGVSNNTAVVFSLAFLILIFWMSSIITPLRQMQVYIEKIKNGDEKAELNVDRKDEIGELAHALVEMKEEINAQQHAKEEMIHNISHDLKSPIATIKSYAESIKDGIYPYDTLEKSVDVIINNADRLEKKVYSLLFLNRLEYMMDQERDTDKTSDMSEIIDDVLLSLKMIRPEIKIIRNITPAVFKGDPESWRVVVSNLLDNQLRYANTTIEITLSEGFLSIGNDGECISQQRMEKLFKPFEKGTQGKFGLGLSICHRVCTTYGFSIGAENLEQGVVFKIEANKDTTKKRRLRNNDVE